MNRLGGEAEKITDVKNDIEDYAWSPDGKKILLVMSDIDYADTSAYRQSFALCNYALSF